MGFDQLPKFGIYFRQPLVHVEELTTYVAKWVYAWEKCLWPIFGRNDPSVIPVTSICWACPQNTAFCQSSSLIRSINAPFLHSFCLPLDGPRCHQERWAHQFHFGRT